MWKRGGLLHSAIFGRENPPRGLEQKQLGPQPGHACTSVEAGEGLGALLGAVAAAGRMFRAACPLCGSHHSSWQVKVAHCSPKC